MSTVQEKTKNKYSVEFFHIYTDETIGDAQNRSLSYLNEMRKAWDIDHDLIVLIDDYNPTNHITTKDEIIDYLNSQNTPPAWWAYEGALVKNAQILLESVDSAKLKRSYEEYIKKNGKYPCSLLTASWYLTRLGVLPQKAIINCASNSGKPYEPTERLINILPNEYRPIEVKVRKIISRSPYKDCLDRIQNLFYPSNTGKAVQLW